MLQINQTQFTGRITHELELTPVSDKRNAVNFQVAIDDSYFDTSEKKMVERPQFVACSAFGTTADRLVKAKVGHKFLYFTGKLTSSSWETDGKRNTRTTIEVTDWQFAEPKKEGAETAVSAKA